MSGKFHLSLVWWVDGVKGSLVFSLQCRLLKRSTCWVLHGVDPETEGLDATLDRRVRVAQTCFDGGPGTEGEEGGSEGE